MASTTAFIDVPESPDRIRQLIGGFGSLPDRLPCIPESELSEGGRVWRLTNQDGGVLVECLQAFDHTARSYSYAIEQASFLVAGYLSPLSVRPVPGRTAAAHVEWSGSFTPVGVSDAGAEELFHSIYTDGLAALLKRYSGVAGLNPCATAARPVRVCCRTTTGTARVGRSGVCCTSPAGLAPVRTCTVRLSGGCRHTVKARSRQIRVRTVPGRAGRRGTDRHCDRPDGRPCSRRRRRVGADRRSPARPGRRSTERSHA
ncbi:SRPBCC family protein [Streptomyces sp. NPDC059629]|uniref:SRPBCC family protein n=1 Tax=Streptomyces sp. NPDC059629 TaxID=3346889 RepID=UPI00367C4B3A